MPRDPLADLLAYSGHELRTPLTSLSLAIEMCADGTLGPLEAVQRETLAGALEDCGRLRQLIDELTDPVLAGDHTRLATIPIDLATAVAAAIATAIASAGARLITLLADAASVELTTDPARLTRAIARGLDHAITCAARGSMVTIANQDRALTITWKPDASAPATTMASWLCARLVEALGGSCRSAADRLVLDFSQPN